MASEVRRRSAPEKCARGLPSEQPDLYLSVPEMRTARTGEEVAVRRVVSLLSVLVASMLIAVVAPSAPTHAADDVLVGVVRDAESGRPLAGITVMHNKTCRPNTPGSSVNCAPNGVPGASTVTDGAGHYTLPVDRLKMSGMQVVGFFDPQGHYEPTSTAFDATATTLDVRLKPNGYGPHLEAARLPVIVGSVKPGATLSVRPAVWNLAVTILGYTWSADGSVVGTGEHHVVQQRDLGHRITVTARVWARGAEVTSATSLPVVAAAPQVPAKAAKAPTRLTVDARHRRHARKVRLIVTAHASGRTPTGVVRVYRGAKLLKRVTLVKGRVTVRLTRQPTGKQRYRAVYAGTPTLLGATATVRVRV